jgi:hypothetical protein
MALTKTDQLVLGAMLAFQDAATLGEQQDAVKRVADVIGALVTANKSARDWLNNAPIDYSNGVEHGGYDEGNVRGWQGHAEIVKELDVAVAKAEPPLVCHHCQSVIHPGDKEFEDGDGTLCYECYRELYATRDEADARWRRGDIEYDRSRGN